MSDDELKIRELIATWMSASAAGDVQKVLTLMAEDAIFLIPGRPPMRGRAEFAATSKGMEKVRMEGKSEVQEIQVSGNMAYCWTNLTVTMFLPDKKVVRAGNTLSVLRKEANGQWVMFRDANLLTVMPDETK